MKVFFITSNKSKFEWAKRRFSGLPIELSQMELQIEEPRELDVEKVALHKARTAAKSVKEPFIMEDTSFCIPALNNFPATNIKFVIQTIGVTGIIKLLNGEQNRKAIFRSALVFVENGKEHSFVCDDVGAVSMAPKGSNTNGFNDLFKIFIPEGQDKTLAEMNSEEFSAYEKSIEKNDHYHKFGEWIAKTK